MSRTTMASWKKTVIRLRRNALELETYGWGDGHITEPPDVEKTPLRRDGTSAIVDVTPAAADATTSSAAAGSPTKTGDQQRV